MKGRGSPQQQQGMDEATLEVVVAGDHQRLHTTTLVTFQLRSIFGPTTGEGNRPGISY